MNPLILVVAAVGWYSGIEFALLKLRRDAPMPSRALFWLSLMQSIGAFALTLGAAIVYFGW